MYAIVEIKGFQYRAEKNAVLRVPYLKTAEPGQTLTFDKVLLLREEEEIKVGQPVVEGASIVAEVIENGKGEKKIIYHHKRRKGYRVKKGYRESYTDLRVTDILA
ncbi:MAG: 50S ribosomal protein L21 [Candidatus Cloacimonadota bacterium]|jgi:large subunit ribosomal protein L21|uniref:Large ribosomal subunit protein bL21 n=1 Tax=Cloacimonas acidaminovorans (strain Evry) TaxID=459349 RepID=B0VFE7_CLOAI|nr:50S ribosomal protein L21 [Candidatus Cloacimonas acidaminovorans]MBP8704471.1 50S ribosomal protein L21 [Candidatus Cloacimonas sp.]MDI9571642.1 50S ribosomal protein L21 [Candidatus Cloacimonadota bacterium]MDD3606157.1 50S ribosomal protein L21 [Candidatus Cloacimonas acidaminovorans]MDD5407218.1 50S ribosomal protein L21 [Candidatus Cloacimonas acidaminovorans]MDY0219115.1 50S ribosomal protein L21 [Candidatus Cloacimonas acidaminovorans]